MKLLTWEIFETASDAIFVLDVGGIILDCNKSAEKLYEYINQDLVGKSFSILYPRFHSNEIGNITNNILSGKDIEPVESERITSGNKLIRVSAAFSPIKDNSGKIIGISCVERKLVSKDSQVSKQAETAPAVLDVKDSNKKVEALLQRINLATSAIHLGIWEIDFTTGIVHWDENMYELFDLPNNYPINFETWQSFIHPDDRSRILDVYHNSIKNKTSLVDFDLRVITPAGREKYLLSKMLLFTDNNDTAIKAIGANWDDTEQLKARKALQESERNMRLVLQATKERIYLLDRVGRILLMNDEARRILNGQYNGAKIFAEGDFIIEATPTELKEKVTYAIKATLTGEVVEYEANTIIQDKEQWFIHTFLPVRNEKNEIDGVAIISLDITKRKQAEIKQQALLQRLNLITSAVKLGTFESDLLTGKMVADENLYRIYDLDSTLSFTMEVFSNALHPQDRERVLSNINEAVRSNASELNQEFRIITRQGKEKYILNKTLFIGDKNDKVVKAIGSNWDITDLQKTREALQESGRKMNALLHSTREGIYLYDTNLRLILMNEQGEKFAEMRSGEKAVIGQHVSAFTREDEIESVEKILQTVLKGQAYDIERNIPSKDGSLWLHLTYNPVKENNAIIGVCIVARDVTELVHSRENLVAARQRAEQSERLQEQFLANMSHEIRTPLNGIVGMSNLLLNTPLNEQQKEFLHSILHSSDNLLFLINDILDLSKIKAGKFRIEKIPMTVRELLEELATPFKIKAQEKGLRFSVMMDPYIPKAVLGDPHRLVQVLNNLLSNAVKFTEKGFIKLEAELVENTASHVVLNFIVTDSGIGIDEQLQEHIFESFAQAGSDTARRYGGSGLGLAITKRLIELQGGSISVSSIKHKGSSFLVSIPYELANERDITKKEIFQPTGNEKPSFLGKRVLVAEDNEVNQQVILHLLKDYGIKPTIVADGQQAVNLLEEDPSFDLILLDLRMPVMDGFQALARIRQKMKLSIPVIVLTASVLRDERDRCLEMGANDYQAKPFSRPILLQCLQRFLV